METVSITQRAITLTDIVLSVQQMFKAHKAENLEQIRKQYVEILQNTGQSEYLSFSM
jgi:hypothetical protein